MMLRTEGGAGRHHSSSSPTPQTSYCSGRPGRPQSGGVRTVNTEHLLHAALENGVVRRVLEEADANPDQIRAQLEEETGKEARKDASPSLAPDAKRALLAAYEEAQALGSSYIGPEHVLLALADDDEGEAGKLLSRFGLSHTKLRGAVVRGVDTRRRGARAGQLHTYA